MVVSRQESRVEQGDPRTRMPEYLSGVQGLRTVAALMVAVYHIWFGRVSGGVDVFFVVAGYFAAKSLMRMGLATDARGRFAVATRYWLRTLRRITPSAIVVIIGTVVASMLFMPQSAWQYAIPHGFASLFHFENWQLVAANADYLQDGMAASPFQQFWALSLQVQFYLVFPLLLLAVTTLAKGRAWSARRTAAVLLASVLILSFIFSVWYTAIDQPAAYFNTFARGWEFMAGAILSLAMTRGLANKPLASAMGWIGLLVLLALGATLDVSTLFPGWAALIPVAAAILIMISAASGRAPIVLSRGPMVWFGNASFAFYLWHWPILVLYRYRFGEQVGIKGGLAILLVAAVLAYITTRFVETPIREWKRIQRGALSTILVVALLMAPAYGALAYWQQTLSTEQHRAQELQRKAVEGEEIPEGELVPSIAQARDDYVDSYQVDGCHQVNNKPEVNTCFFGDENAERTIAIVGGSHSAQWVDLVRRAAERVDARLEVIIKHRCLFADIDELHFERDPSCAPWAASALEHLLEEKPDLVVTMANRQMDGSDELQEPFLDYFRALDERGIPVIGIRDNPRFDYDVPECIEKKGIEACEQPRDEFYDDDEEFDFSELDDFTFVDILEDICPVDTCEVVQENVLMYRDKHHLTRTWTLRFGDRVENAIVNWFAQNRS